MKAKADMAAMVAEVQALARANYDKSYGWQVWEECHSDKEIVERLGQTATLAGARRVARKCAAIWTEQEQEVSSTAW